MVKKLLVLGAILSISSIFAINEDDVSRLVDKVMKKQVDLQLVPKAKIIKRYKHIKAITYDMTQLLQSDLIHIVDNNLFYNERRVIDLNYLFTELRVLRSDAVVHNVKVYRECAFIMDEIHKRLEAAGY